jgi:small redox-active disulfide protein 2
MRIEILGPGCPNCQRLHESVETAVRELGLACEIEKVTDIQRIVRYNVLSTPVLVVDGQIKVAGRVPSKDEIKALLA